jgi:uncharacterized protein
MERSIVTALAARRPTIGRTNVLIGRRGAGLATFAILLCLASRVSALQADAAPLPELTAPVNDFANVIDSASAGKIDQLSRSLQAASGDVVVVASVPTIAPYGDIREYAVKLFENHGRGIGEKGKDNGVLIVLAVKERRVYIEVGYGLEQWITDGYSGETSRDDMVPEFKNGNYGAGLANGTARIVGRIAEGRHVTLQNVQLPRSRPSGNSGFPWSVILIIVFLLVMSRRGRRGGGGGLLWPLLWMSSGWSGWSSGVGPLGGGRWGGGGFGRGGGGGFGGFGGFGGGGSGGGGGGGSW